MSIEKLPEDKRERILSVGIKEFSNNSYKDVSTDTITKKCGISKGLLFHYFGSKKNYYLYCLNEAMDTLTKSTSDIEGNDFYDILFSAMNQKMRTCLEHHDEMLMVNMASRDMSAEIAREKTEVLQKYKIVIQRESNRILNKAIEQLKLKNDMDPQKMMIGLHMYINSILNTYLAKYQHAPDLFFENSLSIKEEMKEYLDLMLKGICEKEI